MLKKIHVRSVRSGMFINEICGSWMEHPFWKKAFLLSTDEDLKTLKTCGIQEVWIDTEKGLDVEGEVLSPSREEEQKKVEAELKKVATENRVVQRVPVQNEVQRARAILSKGKAAVTSMFNEARMGKAISVSEAEPLVDEISNSIARNPEAFLNLARLKNVDDYTYMHSVAVCGLMIALGKQLGLDGRDLKDAGIAGLMHDVGKALIPNEVLNKPGKLTDEEFEIIKTHPRRGWEILNVAEGANDVALDVCLHHHERVDGTGYPERISGDLLTLFARMGAVCDVYDALTSNRCYKNGWEPAETIRKMAEWRNGHFDERVFQAFVKTIGIYPSGTLVRLKSGRLAIVIEQTEKSLLMPIVKAFFSTKSNEPIMPEMIDLSRSRESIASAEDPAQWGFDLKQIAGF
ncbi:HD-GYP domain-containing protein [Sideroxydans lithotrophicus]|uniref:Metal dependent phosphohydrolase n=1 Tax=Sideroxydans lithotrophicus (strain ES-1) TaxID=580332 RepID=D5CTB8_SIDLE|nr:HD-GYP domain-containing protein [Sideroxydans lithotrophicus]ADE12204.1 metal dependent phosphohydrolase [Sideroxydans lithotrophicus ES-1]